MKRRLGILLLACLPAVAAGASITDGQAAYDSGRFQVARDIWRDLAESGDAQAAYRLGALYERGDGVGADPSTAYCWYRLAADGGVPAAAFNVAVMHDSGRGAPQDAALAASWYGRAAALGFPRAQFNLGQLYEAGEGVPRNAEAAAAWYRRAAASGIDAASDRLAALRRAGRPQAATVPRPVSLDAPGMAWGAGVPLTWPAVAQGLVVSYYVEVVAIGAPVQRPVFTASTELSAALAALPPGRYAGRVAAVAADASHYALGAWTRFAVAPGAPSARCNAAP